MANTSQVASRDITLPADATDTISSVRWSPVSNHLAASSWDGKVRIYDIAADGLSRPAAMLSGNGPILSCDWSMDGMIIAAGGADKTVQLLDLPTGHTGQIGSHDAPIRSVRFVKIPSSSGPILATGSWDKTVKYWDLRQAERPVATLVCADRVLSMDTAESLLVIATAEQHIHLVDLSTDPCRFARTTSSPLKHQTRVVTAFPDGKGWATASIEGRCAMNAAIESEKQLNFTFRCHRDLPDTKKIIKVWAVNDVNFHPKHPTVFTTAGSDGSFHFWDRIARQRLVAFPPAIGSITATAFNRDGSFFAYAIGYDWSMGYQKNTPDYPTKLILHSIKEIEIVRRGK